MRLIPMQLLKCWAIGLAFSLIVVASEVFGLHTPFGIVAILFGIPIFILTSLVTGGHRHEDGVVYTLMALCGIIFYGFLFYVISALIRRISSKKLPATRS